MATATSKRWWLALNGATDGPRTEAYITAQLQSGELRSTTQACLEGTTHWTPLSQWPEFAKVITAPSPPLPPPGDPLHQPVLTNPRLPPFANWICIYSIVVAPLLWLVFNCTCLLNPVLYVSEEYARWEAIRELILGVLELPIFIVIAIGGMHFKRLLSSGVTMIRVGILLRLAVGVISLVIQFLVDARAEAQGIDTSMDMRGPAMFIVFLYIVVSLADLVFNILALIWLTMWRRFLPLKW